MSGSRSSEVSSSCRQWAEQVQRLRKGLGLIFIVFLLICVPGCTDSSDDIPFTNEGMLSAAQPVMTATGQPAQKIATSPRPETITVFLSGDVMTGRGIDQVLPYPSHPDLHEPYVRDAREYVQLAERKNGPIERPVSFDYIWGYALERLEQESPDLRLINLETSITTSDDYWRGKGIHYRMHPKNVAVLKAARIDVCTLANNHVLDWGYRGLTETVDALSQHHIKAIGAGGNLHQAEAPAVLGAGAGRVLVFSLGSTSSGIPARRAASEDSPGVNLIRNLSGRTVERLQQQIRFLKRQGDVVITSVHWGGNWGYEIPAQQVEFAHQLIDLAGVDIVHGHSSHHVKGIEVYQGRLILYGCGDLVSDYEGIPGRESFRSDLGLMYFASLDPSSGKLTGMRMAPVQMKNFRLNQPSLTDVLLLWRILDRECKRLGTRVELSSQDRTLTLHW